MLSNLIIFSENFIFLYLFTILDQQDTTDGWNEFEAIILFNLTPGQTVFCLFGMTRTNAFLQQ